MLSMINKQTKLGEVFKSISGLTEVYADANFSMEQEAVALTLLCRHPIDSAVALFKIQSCFEMPINIYVVYDAFSALLSGKRIIWREGAWFV